MLALLPAAALQLLLLFVCLSNRYGICNQESRETDELKKSMKQRHGGEGTKQARGPVSLAPMGG